MERRLANLERLHGDDGPPHVTVVTYPGASEDEIAAAKEKAMREQPGKRFYYVVVRPPGQDAP